MADLPPGFDDDMPPGFGDDVVNTTTTAVQQQDEEEDNKDIHPPKYLRKIVRDHASKQKKLSIGALRFLPHAIYKCLENMPMPWEPTREVEVLYHVAGVMTVINETPRVPEPLYVAQWGTMWTAMRREKKNRENFSRLQFPVFKDDQPPLDFVEDLLPYCDGLVPVHEELDEDGDEPVINWFYDVKPRLPSAAKWDRKRNTWTFPIEVMTNLHRLSTVILSDHIDRNYFYLFEKNAFMTSKAIRRPNEFTIKGAPKFRTLYPNDTDPYDDDWTEFNDLHRVIVRHRIDSDAQVAYPYLYSREIRQVSTQPYHYPAEVYIPDDDPERDPFFFNRAFNEIKGDVPPAAPALTSSCHDIFDAVTGEDLELEMPDDFAPMLDEVEMEDVDTKAALLLCWAPPAFSTFRGNTKRRIDVPLIERWYQERCSDELPHKVRLAYQHLLKELVLRQKTKNPKRTHTKRTLAEALEKSTPFQKTRIDWLEATMQMLQQGHTALSLVLKRKGLSFVHLDYNFNVQPTRTLTTKERKKSRLGDSFHIVRELLVLIKLLADAHIKFRVESGFDGYKLADAIHYLFTHMSKLTGIHRNKYRAMHQERMARDVKRLIYSRFNTGGVGKGPGMGFWAPAWRVWIFFMRGMTPLLHRYLNNLVDRLIEGRRLRGTTKRITKQRVESNFNVNFKKELRADVAGLLPSDADDATIDITQKKIAKTVENVYREWKRGAKWEAPQGLPKALEEIIRANVKKKADWYTEQAHLCRVSVQKGLSVDKNMFEKNRGKLSRLKIMKEKERQQDYMTKEPELQTEDAAKMLEAMEEWVSSRGINKIAFPRQNHPAEIHLMKLSHSRLLDAHNIGNRLTQSQKEEKRLIEEALDNPHEHLAKIRDNLARNRRFKALKIEFSEYYSHLVPQYTVDPSEKLVDSYLDAYLWYEASKSGSRLFPNWVKPADTEPLPVLTYRMCEGINNGTQMWDCEKGEKLVMVKTGFGSAFYDKVDWTLFRRLLLLIMDETLVDYICTRHDVFVEYKDMSFLHHCGIIRGLAFSSFLTQYWGLMIDLMILGPQRAQQLAGPPNKPNPFMKFVSTPTHETVNPIRGYCRHLNTAYVIVKLSEPEARNLTERYLEANPNVDQSVANFNNKKCWPRDCRMRLWSGDVKTARAVMWFFKTRLPKAVGDEEAPPFGLESSFASVYSSDNPNLLFDIGGFELRIQPVHRADRDEMEQENMWNLVNATSNEVTARAYVQVTEEHVVAIKNRVRRGIMSVGNAAFQKIAQKWNAVLTDVLPYYREALMGTPGLQQVLVHGEKKMQTRIMLALNSKNARRFPPVIFYAPIEMGGLGMLSVSKSLIPTRDMTYSAHTSTGVQGFVSVTNDAEESAIPNLIGYYTPWETEMQETKEANRKYMAIKVRNRANGQRVRPDDVEDIIDKGIPRLRILFSKERELYAADCGFRVRREMTQFVFGRPLKFWWFSDEHDGRLCGGLEKYRKDMIQALGGVEAILEHSLFKGTGFPSWEGLNWKKGGGFENSLQGSKLTKAQAGGLTEVPNRRFALWWSPTINRQDIYAGYEAQIQLTGIMMSGKLEKVKIPLIALFSNHLWEKIHQSVVGDIASAIAVPENSQSLGVADGSTEIKQNHPQKSYTLNRGKDDIVMDAVGSWMCSPPSLITDPGAEDKYTHRVKNYWIDVQLRWGNYDSHNIAEYARSKFNEFTGSRIANMYPSRAGIIVAVDLAYNCHSAFGYWIPGMKDFLTIVLNRIMKNNTGLYALRARMRKSLQLYSSDPTEARLGSGNYSELFSEEMRTIIIDNTKTMTRSEHSTTEGNKKFRVENGAISIFDPRTGTLRYCVVHKSVFAGKKRKQKLALDKAAEVVTSFIKSLPREQQPKQIICLKSEMQQPLNHALSDFPNIVIRSTELSLPIAMLHSHSTLGTLRNTATESKQFAMSVYDDWGMKDSSSTCFKRLMMILRGLHINDVRTRTILEPDAHVTRQAEHFWPTLPDEEWNQVEHQLADMIFEDYARKNGTSVAALTKQEKQDIILGKQITAIDIQQEEMAELEQKAKKQLATVTTTNRAGELVKRRVAFAPTTGINTTISEWRPRAIQCPSLAKRVNHLMADNIGVAGKNVTDVIFPKNLLKRFLLSADVELSVVAFMYGVWKPDSPIVEVRCLMLPKQRCEMHTCEFPSYIPTHEDIEESGLELIGVLRTERGEAVVNTCDLVHQAQLFGKQQGSSTKESFCVILSLDEDSCRLRAFSVTNEGMKWGVANGGSHQIPKQVEDSHVGDCRVHSTEKFQGFFLTPSQGSWNYTFIGATWKQQGDEEYDVGIAAPQDFFSAQHNRDPFENFKRNAAGELEDDDNPFN